MFTLVLPDGWRLFGEARLFAAVCIINADAGETVRCPQERELRECVRRAMTVARVEQYAREICTYLGAHVVCAPEYNAMLRDVGRVARYLLNPSVESVSATTMLQYIVGAPGRTVAAAAAASVTGHKRKDVPPPPPFDQDEEEEEEDADDEPALKRVRTKEPAIDIDADDAVASLASMSELLDAASVLWDKLSPFTTGSKANLVFSDSCAERVCSLLSAKDQCNLRLTSTVGRNMVDRYAAVQPVQFFWALSEDDRDYALRLAVPLMRRSSLSLADCVSMVCAAVAHNRADVVRAVALEFSERRGLPLRECFITAWRGQTELGDGTEVSVHHCEHGKRSTTPRRVDDVHGLIHVLDAYMTASRHTQDLSGECLAAAIDYGIIDMQTPATARYAMQAVLSAWLKETGDDGEKMQLLLSKIPTPLRATLADPHMASLVSQLPVESYGAMRVLVKAGIRMKHAKVRSPLSVYVARNDAKAVKILLPAHMREGLTRRVQERLILCSLAINRHTVLEVLLKGGVRCRLSEVVTELLIGGRAVNKFLVPDKVGAVLSDWLECTCRDARRKSCDVASGLKLLTDYIDGHLHLWLPHQKSVIQRIRAGAFAFAAGIAQGASVCKKWRVFVLQHAQAMAGETSEPRFYDALEFLSVVQTLSGATLLAAAKHAWDAWQAGGFLETAPRGVLLPMGVEFDRLVLDNSFGPQGQYVASTQTFAEMLFRKGQPLLPPCEMLAKCVHRIALLSERAPSSSLSSMATVLSLYSVLQARLPGDIKDILIPESGLEFAPPTLESIVTRLERFDAVRACAANTFVRVFSFDFASYVEALSDVELASAVQRDGPHADALSYAVGMLGCKLFDDTHMQAALVVFMKTRMFRVTPSIRLRGVHPADVNCTTGVHRVFPMKIQGLATFSLDAPTCTWIWSDEPSARANTQDAECAAGTVADV